MKDWPEDARKVFNEVKNQLWTWSKKYEKSGSRQGLGLIAYMAVKQVWEDESDPRANMQIINCETEEDLWNTVSKIASRS